jgi:hypothetical protein
LTMEESSTMIDVTTRIRIITVLLVIGVEKLSIIYHGNEPVVANVIKWQ